MLEIKVNVSCPELRALAEALSTLRADKPAPEMVAPAATPAAPSAPITPVNPTPVAPIQAPVTAAPQITLDQIGKAGADLINRNPAAMPQLMALLQKYGVQSAQQLKSDQIGAFATEMRTLGAMI